MKPNLNTQARCQVQGYFKLEAHQEDDTGHELPGSRRTLADWTPNLITDNGLELLKSSGFLNYLMVGSGSTAPATTDTQLGAFVAGMAASVSQGPSDLTPTDYPWCSANVSCQFGKGVAAGNLSELGVGTSQTDMFARALIKDANGNPTTITVLPIELLTVTYQWRVYWDLTYSHTDTFTTNGTAYTCTTMQGAMATKLAVNWNDGLPYVNKPPMEVFSGTATGAGAEPTGYIGHISPTRTNGPAGSAYIDYAGHASVNQLNASFNCVQTGVTIVGAGDQPRVKTYLSPAIVKDNTMELDITLRFAWGRKVSA